LRDEENTFCLLLDTIVAEGETERLRKPSPDRKPGDTCRRRCEFGLTPRERSRGYGAAHLDRLSRAALVEARLFRFARRATCARNFYNPAAQATADGVSKDFQDHHHLETAGKLPPPSGARRTIISTNYEL
jgi:hypothetical protein